MTMNADAPAHVTIRSALLLAAAALVSWLSPALWGDVVMTHDGREFEGTILPSTNDIVKVDAVVAGTRVTITLVRDDVKTIDKRPLPENFYTPAEPAPEEKAPPPDPGRYLEVPIVGRFGLQVVPQGVRDCLSYAIRNRIKHVVFFIDSQGGDRIAAREIYKLLASYDQRLVYHAVVRDSVGVAMVVPVWCKDVHLLPGANLGGVLLGNQEDGGEAEVVLSQVAHEVSIGAEKKGWPPAIVRAMIDPAETVGIWVGPNGEVKTGRRVPPDVRQDDIVRASGPESVLTLGQEEAVKIGIGRAASGGASQLGGELGLPSWVAAGDYGKTTMAKAAAEEQKRQQRTATKNEATIKKLLDRREATKLYIERNLTQANSFDPNQAAYSTFKEHRSSWESYWGGGSLPGTITRVRWQELTDETVAALRNAYKGTREMQKLEAEARQLGLDPLYEEGVLDTLLADIESKVKLLLYWRERKTKSA